MLLAAAQSVADDERYAAVVLEPPEVWGVQSYEEKWLTLRVVIHTKARESEPVARALRLAARDALSAAGIASPAAIV